MHDRDCYGMPLELGNDDLPSDIAPGRDAMMKSRNLRNRRVKLDGELAELRRRRLQAVRFKTGLLAGLIARGAQRLKHARFRLATFGQ